MQHSTSRQAKQKICANLDHHWSMKCSLLCVQTNWVCPSGTQSNCKMTLTRVSSHWLWLESSHFVKNMTTVESSHHFSQRKSSRVRVTTNHESSRVIVSSHSITAYNVEFIASTEETTWSNVYLNCYYAEDHRFDSFFGWLRVTQHCACNKWLPACRWLQSSVNLQSHNWTERYSNLQSQNWSESCEEVQKKIINSNPIRFKEKW